MQNRLINFWIGLLIQGLPKYHYKWKSSHLITRITRFFYLKIRVIRCEDMFIYVSPVVVKLGELLEIFSQTDTQVSLIVVGSEGGLMFLS